MEDQKLAVTRAPEQPQYQPPSVISPFSGVENFASAQRMATLLAASTMVPDTYRGDAGVANCVVALEVSSRMGVSPLMLMQNMAIIEGRPALSAQFLIAMVNTCRKFSPLRYKMRDLGQKQVKAEVWEGPRGQRVKRQINLTIHDKGCRAWAKELATGEILEGPEVTIELAVAEGWYTRNGSKWQTMPDVMLTYRSAAFFSRLYAPEMALGLHTTEEREDLRAGSIDVESTTVDAPVEVAPPELPRRATRAPREAKTTVVDVAATAAPAAATPAPAPAAAETAPPPPPAAKPKAASVTGLAKRTEPFQPKIVDPPATATPAGDAKVVAWMADHNVTIAELSGALSDYLGDEINLERVDQLKPEQIEFIHTNAAALADAIKGTRV